MSAVDLSKAYYVVDPDANLNKTREVVLPELKKLGFSKGLVGPKERKVHCILLRNRCHEMDL